MTFFTGAPFACFATSARRPRRGLDRRLVGGRGHDDLAAQLAVDLQHQLDFVLQRAPAGRLPATRASSRSPCSRANPRSRHSTTSMCGTTGYSTRSRIDRPFADDAGCARGVGRQRFERVQHLHAGGHDRVELDALVVVVRLLQRRDAARAARPPLRRTVRYRRRRTSRTAPACACANAHSRFRKRVRAFDAGVRPSSVASGGAANIMNSRAVSAPYWSIERPAGRRRCASTSTSCRCRRTRPAGRPALSARAGDAALRVARRPSTSAGAIVVDAALVACGGRRCGSAPCPA